MTVDTKNIAINIAILILTAIITLFIIEFTLGFFTLEGDQFWMQDDRVGSIHIPNKEGKWISPLYNTNVKINSIGFRDKEHTLEKSPNTYRIIILGDSFVEALQVPIEKSFPVLLEQKLNAEPKNKTVEVIILGCSGWGTSNEYLALQKIGLDYQPDMVIIAFLTGNDVRDNSYELSKECPGANLNRPFYNISHSGELVLVNPNWNKTPIPILTTQPYVNYFEPGKNFFKKIFPKTSVFIAKRISDIQSSKFVSGQNKENAVLPPLHIDTQVYCGNTSKDYDNAWNTTKGLLLKTKHITDSHNATFLLVSLMNIGQTTNPIIWESYDRNYPECAPFEMNRPEIILSDFCQENNISYLPLFPQFEDYLNKNPNTVFHNNHDGHWTEKGHELAADIMFDYISHNYSI